MVGLGGYRSLCILYFSLTSGFVLQRETSLSSCREYSMLESQNSRTNFELSFHHAAIRTQNITRAIDFYSLLLTNDCEVEDTELSIKKFRAGPARAAWLETKDRRSRIELIEVPMYILNDGEENEDKLYRAPDLMKMNKILGHNHVAFEVGIPLVDFFEQLQKKSIDRFNKTIRVAVEQYTQIIDEMVYELAFLFDADGSLVELLHRSSERQSQTVMEDPWQAWDGTGFRGPTSPR